jgi:hypothetical protein
MVKGDDAGSYTAGKVGLWALVIGVEGGPAPSAGLCIRALIAIMPGILAMTFEAVEVWWQLTLA